MSDSPKFVMYARQKDASTFTISAPTSKAQVERWADDARKHTLLAKVYPYNGQKIGSYPITEAPSDFK
jgi:hypothetical protein